MLSSGCVPPPNQVKPQAHPPPPPASLQTLEGTGDMTGDGDVSPQQSPWSGSEDLGAMILLETPSPLQGLPSARRGGSLDAQLNITQQTLMKTNFPPTFSFCLHSRNMRQAVQKRRELYQNKLGLVPTASFVPFIDNQPGQEHLLHSEGRLSIICAPQHRSREPFPPKQLSVLFSQRVPAKPLLASISTKLHDILGMVRDRWNHCLLS